MAKAGSPQIARALAAALILWPVVAGGAVGCFVIAITTCEMMAMEMGVHDMEAACAMMKAQSADVLFSVGGLLLITGAGISFAAPLMWKLVYAKDPGKEKRALASRAALSAAIAETRTFPYSPIIVVSSRKDRFSISLNGLPGSGILSV